MNSPVNILILCTANSARSILGEALIARHGGGRFNSFSAGSHPRGVPNPDGLKLLEMRGYDISGFRSKSWDEFAGPNAPLMDIIVTVCDNAAGEVCPIWPSAPGKNQIKVHWPAPDPAHIEPRADREAMFAYVYEVCRARILAMMAVPIGTLTSAQAKARLQQITYDFPA